MCTFSEESDENFDWERCSDDEKLLFIVPLALQPIRTYLKIFKMFNLLKKIYLLRTFYIVIYRNYLAFVARNRKLLS